MVDCVTKADLDAAQAVLNELQTAIEKARQAHDDQMAAAEAAEEKERERLWSEAQEVDDGDDDGLKVKKRMVAMFLAYNGHGFSVSSSWSLPLHLLANRGNLH